MNSLHPKIGDLITPLQAMQLAVRIAKNGAGFVAPNPLVGCVIVTQDHRLLSMGWHQKYGGPHAEIEALTAPLLRDPTQLKGATVYVTLEPCSHQGKTPSCAKTLSQFPLAKVVYGLEDPNPLVSGRGRQILKDHGIQVDPWTEDTGPLEDLAEVFLHNMRTHSAFVTLKSATSADGQLALKSGESQWITGFEARQQAHEIRAHHDAVMIGQRTFLLDNPKLNIRHPHYADKTNFVLIVDPEGQALAHLKGSHLWTHHSPHHIIWVVKENLEPLLSTVNIWPLPLTQQGELDLNQLNRHALSQGITSILIEGGSKLISSALRQKSAQRWTQFLAPHLLGSRHGLNVTSEYETATMSDRITLVRPQWTQVGHDICLTGRL